MDFPEELANPDLVEALVQHSDDDQVIGLRIDACLNHGDPSSWSNFLRSSGLVERETLNHVARSGACQFSAVADQLFRSRPVTESFRPDVYLRLLALHCVSKNQEAFQDFMLDAAPMTRQQRQRGGGGVDMEEYARRMASNRCDGDHITLQALCDALKVNINVVKWTRDVGWCPRTSPSDSAINPAPTTTTAAAAIPSLPHSTSDAAAPPPPDAGPATGGEARRPRPRRSVFVADTLRPRAVACLDARARAVQLQGRTLWLSLHGEAHFRSLRVRDPVTEEEAAALARAGTMEGSANGSANAAAATSSSSSSSSTPSSSPPSSAGGGRSSPRLGGGSSSRSSPSPAAWGSGRALGGGGGAEAGASGGRTSPRLRPGATAAAATAAAAAAAAVNEGGRGHAAGSTDRQPVSPPIVPADGGFRVTGTGGDRGTAKGCADLSLVNASTADRATEGSAGGVDNPGRSEDSSARSSSESGVASGGTGSLPNGGSGSGGGGVRDSNVGGGVILPSETATLGPSSTGAAAARGQQEGQDPAARVAARSGGAELGTPGEATHTAFAEVAGKGEERPAQPEGDRDVGGHPGARSDGGNGAEEEGEEEVEDCSICMCAVTGEEDAASLDKCTHAFHFACIIKWGETVNQCPMCKAHFFVVTRLRDSHTKRFRGRKRGLAAGAYQDQGPMLLSDFAGLRGAQEAEPEGARAVCLHCGDGGAAEQLILCDGGGCENGAHTFCCGLEEVPPGDWFCPSCEEAEARRVEAEARRREAAARRDAILRRAWAIDSGFETEEGQEVYGSGSSSILGGERRRRGVPRMAAGEEAGAAAGVEGGRRAALAATLATRRRTAGGVGVGTFSAAVDEGLRARNRGSGPPDDMEVEDLSRADARSSDEEEEGGEEEAEFRLDGSDDDREEEGGDDDSDDEPVTRNRAVSRGGVNGRGGDRSSSSSSSRNGSSMEGVRSDAGARGGETGGGGSLARIRPTGGSGGGAIAAIGGSSGVGSNGNRGNVSDSASRGVSDRYYNVSDGGGRGSSSNGSRRGGGGSAGPNFWPRVLESASSSVAPRHAFDEEDGGNLGGSDREEEAPAGAAGVVAQSWEDARLAQQLATETKKKKKGKGPTASKHASRVTNPGNRVGPPQRQQQQQYTGRNGGSTSASSPSFSGLSFAGFATATAAAAPAAAAAAASSSAASVGDASQPAARRVFKRPRRIATSSPPHSAPPPPPPPQSFATKSPRRRYGSGRYDVWQDGDNAGAGAAAAAAVSGRGGGGVGSDGVGRGRVTGTSPRLPAASDVRLGQSEAQALVQRLRRVANKERGRRETSTGWGAGPSRVTGARGEPRVPSDVSATMEELRRVAVHGDATTLDVLLSSQLPSVLRLWLEPTPDGGPFLPSPERASLLKVLMALPVQKSHLRESGIGKLMVAMAADPRETEENRELIEQIVRRWSQLVFKTPRRLPVSPFSPRNGAPPRFPAQAGAAAGSGASGGSSTSTSTGRGAGWAAAVRSHQARSSGAEAPSTWASLSSSPARAFRGTPDARPPEAGRRPASPAAPPSLGHVGRSLSASFRGEGGGTGRGRGKGSGPVPRRPAGEGRSGGSGGGGGSRVERTIPRRPSREGDGQGATSAGAAAAATSSSSLLTSPGRHRYRPGSSSSSSSSPPPAPPSSTHRQHRSHGGAAPSRPLPSSPTRPFASIPPPPQQQQQQQQQERGGRLSSPPSRCPRADDEVLRAARGGTSHYYSGPLAGDKRPREPSPTATRPRPSDGGGGGGGRGSHREGQHLGRAGDGRGGAGHSGGSGGGGGGLVGVMRDQGSTGSSAAGAGGGVAGPMPWRRFRWPDAAAAAPSRSAGSGGRDGNA